MSSRIALCLVFSLALASACTSTDDQQAPSENLTAESSEAAAPGAEVKAAPEAAVEPAAVDASMGAKEEAATDTAAAAPAPAAETATEAAPASQASAEKIVYPTTSLLNLRKGAGTRHAVGRKAKFGEALSLSGEKQGKWLKTSDGLWVSAAFVSDSKPAQANDPIIERAAPAAEAAAPAAAEAPAAEAAPATEAAPAETAAPAAETAAPAEEAAEAPAAQ